jgi:hypothetical protein
MMLQIEIQVVVVMAKNNAPFAIGEGMNQLEATKVSSMPNQTPCATRHILEHTSPPIMNLTEIRISHGHLVGFLNSCL